MESYGFYRLGCSVVSFCCCCPFFKADNLYFDFFGVKTHVTLFICVCKARFIWGGGGGADPAWIERFTLEAESMLLSVYIMRKRLTSSPKPTALTHALIVSLLNRVDPAG